MRLTPLSVGAPMIISRCRGNVCLTTRRTAALMSNHSAEHPNGILNKEVLKSFFAITEKADGTLKWTPGYERIPDNWYRRPLGEVNGYSPVNFAVDFAQMAIQVPEAATVGGNTGTVNSFAGVDLGDITGGIYHTSDLLDPQKFVCYFYQLALALVPDFLRSYALGAVLGSALSLLQNQIGPLVPAGCATIGKSHLRHDFDLMTELLIRRWQETMTMTSRLSFPVQPSEDRDRPLLNHLQGVSSFSRRV